MQRWICHFSFWLGILKHDFRVCQFLQSWKLSPDHLFCPLCSKLQGCTLSFIELIKRWTELCHSTTFHGDWSRWICLFPLCCPCVELSNDLWLIPYFHIICLVACGVVHRYSYGSFFDKQWWILQLLNENPVIYIYISSKNFEKKSSTNFDVMFFF